MKLGIIIPTFNRKKFLEDLLSCLYSQKESGIKFESTIYVIVDGSTDGTIEMMASKFPYCEIILGDGNFWYTKSINSGLFRGLESDCTHFLLMNDDTIIKEGYISNLLNDYQSFSNGEIILGSISLTVEKPLRIFFSGISEFKKWRWKSINYLPPLVNLSHDIQGVHSSSFLPGRGMLFSANVIKKIGFFDEQFLQYGSDTEFCLRATKYGINSFISWNAKIYCHHEETGLGTKFLSKSSRDYFQSYVKPESRNYWYKNWLLIKANTYIIFAPFIFLVVVSVNILNFLKKFFIFKWIPLFKL